ncbi:WD repeat-containing protein 55 [Alosa sapidissima]|uniref:WD repeat-containing protein 55 n=1 Tax=Alosa sapidissima TaxID=34773 RepID=UPI001C08F7C5|nr:WD repeat-containing protein 55 [Alosa sapidissima]
MATAQDVDEEVHKVKSEDEEDNDPDSDDEGSEKEDAEEKEPKEPKVRDTPEDIHFDAIVNTLAFHPKEDIIAAGDIDGDIYLYSYSCTEGETKELWSSGHHLKSCRKVAFSEDGRSLFSVAKDKSVHIMDVEAGKLIKRITKAHSVPINALLLVDENVLATGDDGGTLKVWDMRKGTAIMDLKHHEDFISEIAIDSAKKILLTSSGDGTMGVFNIKRRRFDLVSEYQSGDLTSVSIVKRGRKVICGSSDGTIFIFNWDGFGATSDRFFVQAESLDCIVPITDSLVCAASMDGVIRAINILPNRVVGSVGQHKGEPIEEIARSHDTRFLASSAHDQLVKFWDISKLPELSVSDYRKRKKKHGKLTSLSKKAVGNGDNFFSGLMDEPDTQNKKDNTKKEDDDDDDDEDTDSDSGSD